MWFFFCELIVKPHPTRAPSPPPPPRLAVNHPILTLMVVEAPQTPFSLIIHQVKSPWLGGESPDIIGTSVKLRLYSCCYSFPIVTLSICCFFSFLPKPIGDTLRRQELVFFFFFNSSSQYLVRYFFSLPSPWHTNPRVTPLAAEGLYFCFSSSAALRTDSFGTVARALQALAPGMWTWTVLSDGVRVKLGVLFWCPPSLVLNRHGSAADGVKARTLTQIKLCYW